LSPLANYSTWRVITLNRTTILESILQSILRTSFVAVIFFLLVGGAIGFGVGYAIYQSGAGGLESQLAEAQNAIASYESQISTLQADLSDAQNAMADYQAQITSLESQVAQLQITVSDYEAQIDSLQSQLSQLQSGMADLPKWLDQLSDDLQADTTDQRQYIENAYTNEHFARDLENNLEGLGYTVSYVVVFEFDNTLLWEPLVRVQYSAAFAVLVNPRTDGVVTSDYDDDGDNFVTVLDYPTRDEAFNTLEDLLDTGHGNEGRYLIMAFEGYEKVQFVDMNLGCSTCLAEDLEEDTTDEGEWVKDTHDCDDFARELDEALGAKGWTSSILCIWRKEGDQKIGHAVVKVQGHPSRCMEPIQPIVIEPRFDQDVTAQYDGDSDGTVESLSNPGLIDAQTEVFNFCHGLRGGTDGEYLIFEYLNIEDIPFYFDNPPVD
jgi:prefoldin subunit 5